MAPGMSGLCEVDNVGEPQGDSCRTKLLIGCSGLLRAFVGLRGTACAPGVVDSSKSAPGPGVYGPSDQQASARRRIVEK